jgi:hypothetical protein
MKFSKVAVIAMLVFGGSAFLIAETPAPKYALTDAQQSQLRLAYKDVQISQLQMLATPQGQAYQTATTIFNTDLNTVVAANKWDANTVTYNVDPGTGIVAFSAKTPAATAPAAPAAPAKP